MLRNLLFLRLTNLVYFCYLLYWKKNNEPLEKGEEILLDFDIIDNGERELAKMNKGKEDRKFVNPDSLI